MKKLWRIYHGKHMLRPTVCRTGTKATAVLALSLLWNRFWNDGRLGLDYAFAALGLVCVALSWFGCLSLDGVRVHYLLQREKPKQKRRFQRGMADYIDEAVIPFDELEPEEQSACRMVSSFLTGALFLLLSVLVG